MYHSQLDESLTPFDHFEQSTGLPETEISSVERVPNITQALQRFSSVT